MRMIDKVKVGDIANQTYLGRYKPPCRIITFAAPSSTLTNFPVLVKCNSTFHIGTQTGYDVHFQDLSGNELYFDLDFYDPVTGNGAWWVQIPSLASSGPTSIKMLYGDPAASINGSSPSTLWANYAYVYHFNDLNNLSSVIGSYTPTTGGSVTADMSIVSNSLTGRGLSIVLTSGYGSTKFVLSLANGINTNTGALSILGTTDTPPVVPANIVMDTGWYTYKYFLYDSFTTYAGGGTALSIPFNETNGIYCYGGSTNTSEVSWVVNGTIQDTSSSSPGWMRWDRPELSGTGYSVSHPTKLVLDEIRISTTTYKPAAWLHYEQNQIINHANYTTYGPEE